LDAQSWDGRVVQEWLLALDLLPGCPNFINILYAILGNIHMVTNEFWPKLLAIYSRFSDVGRISYNQFYAAIFHSR
jgi:hypothetical protein